jgi:hypothetical protein
MALTVMVINKSNQNLESPLTIQGLVLPAQSSVYRYSAEDLNSIQHLADISLTAEQFTFPYPAQSITLLVIPQPVWRFYIPLAAHISEALSNLK